MRQTTSSLLILLAGCQTLGDALSEEAPLEPVFECGPGEALSLTTSAAAILEAQGAPEIDELLVVGDLDRDGLADLALADHGWAKVNDAGQTMRVNAVHIVYGGPRLQGARTLEPDATLELAQASPGFRLAAAGDLDGDRLADLVVGAPGDCQSERAGAAYLVYGSRTRLSGLVGLGDAGVAIVAPGPCTWTGRGAAGVGDVDGDGFDDFVVGAYDDDGTPIPGYPTAGSGTSYLFYGGPVRRTGPLSTADADAAFRSSLGPNGLGTAAGPAGDVDGDGLGDLLLVASSVPLGPARVYLLPGQATRWRGPIDVDTVGVRFDGSFENTALTIAGADLDGDGLSDLLIGQDVPPTVAVHVFYGGRPLDPVESLADADLELWTAGMSLALAPGDLDADGRVDLAIGDANLAGGRGGVLIWPGQAERRTGRVCVPTEGSSYLADDHLTPEGGGSFEEAGGSLGIGDLDGDGMLELAVSAPDNSSGNPTLRGRVYLLRPAVAP